MIPLRLALLGFGTVGQWLAEALHTRRAWLQQEYGVVVNLISVGTAHHGLIYRSDGLDIPTLLDLAAARQPLTAHPAVTHWTNVLEGLQATGGDVLAELCGYLRAMIDRVVDGLDQHKDGWDLIALPLISKQAHFF